ncbi:MAG: methionine gamma-lyase family protein [Ruminococcus sp.]|jgi:cystathionine beta-lyase family protein involved in aluminum resistance|nr:methionine gamma-lyase family protein [Ruminococcus sp.]
MNIYEQIDKITEINSEKILSAFIKNKVSSNHFQGTTGYGYDDFGRDNLERVYADIFGKEDALVRHSFVCGTNAISTALFAVLRPNDIMVSMTGKPYDTLLPVIFGEDGRDIGSLKDFGVRYSEDENDLKSAKVCYIQRSRGYTTRKALSVSDINDIIKNAKEKNPNIITIVDNCYGEFVSAAEPDADLLIGSLIKNPGGGIARTGGYITGKKELITLCANRHTSAGIGKEVGCSLEMLREMYLGLFLAPQTVSNALKTAHFASDLFREKGYETTPPNGDIITSIVFNDKDKLIKFCKGIQNNSPVDSHLTPEPWAMPGYDCDVIMAAGTFTMGASIELSADAPIRPPYVCYLQGGLSFEMSKITIMKAMQSI